MVIIITEPIINTSPAAGGDPDPEPPPTSSELLFNEANFTFRKRAAGPPLGAVGQSSPIQGLVRAFDFEISEIEMEPYSQAPSGDPKLGPWSTGIYSHGNTTSVNWKRDTSVRSHGTGSLLMRTPATGGSDSAGIFQVPFLDDFLNATQREALYAGEGETLEVQYRMRVSDAMLAPYSSPSQPDMFKVSIIGQGNRIQGPPLYGDSNDVGGVAGTCSPIEVVHQTRQYNVIANNPGPKAYHSCGASPYAQSPFTGPPWNFSGSGFHGFSQTTFSGTITEQNAVGSSTPTRCVYPAFDANCFSYIADTWYTVKFRIEIGTWGNPDSRIRMWLTADGGATILVADTQIFVDQEVGEAAYRTAIPDTSYKYGKVWFLPYISGRTSATTHAAGDGYLWIDELIVAKGPLGIPDPPRGSYPIVAAIKATSQGVLRDLTDAADTVGPGTGYTTDFFDADSPVGGSVGAWSGKMSWNPFLKRVVFVGTGHQTTAQSLMYTLQYDATTHAWTKTQFGSTSPGTWTHGYDMNASSWYDGKHYYDLDDGDVQVGEVINDLLTAPGTLSILPNMPTGAGVSHLGNPQEWMPTLGTVGRMVRWDGWQGLYSLDPITSTWTQHIADTEYTSLNRFNNQQWMRYSTVKDCIVFGGGSDANTIVRFNPDGSFSTIGATSNPFTTIPSGTSCCIIASPIAAEIIIFDSRTTQVHVLDLDTDTWSRRTSLETFFASLDDVQSSSGAETCFGLLGCSIHEYGAVLFAKGSETARRLWLWRV